MQAIRANCQGPYKGECLAVFLIVFISKTQGKNNGMMMKVFCMIPCQSQSHICSIFILSFLVHSCRFCFLYSVGFLKLSCAVNVYSL